MGYRRSHSRSNRKRRQSGGVSDLERTMEDFILALEHFDFDDDDYYDMRDDKDEIVEVARAYAEVQSDLNRNYADITNAEEGERRLLDEIRDFSRQIIENDGGDVNDLQQGLNLGRQLNSYQYQWVMEQARRAMEAARRGDEQRRNVQRGPRARGGRKTRRNHKKTRRSHKSRRH